MMEISPTLLPTYIIINVGNKVGDIFMDKYIKIIKDIIDCHSEEEWFEFKENWFDAHGIGEYISALFKLLFLFLSSSIFSIILFLLFLM